MVPAFVRRGMQLRASIGILAAMLQLSALVQSQALDKIEVRVGALPPLSRARMGESTSDTNYTSQLQRRAATFSSNGSRSLESGKSNHLSRTVQTNWKVECGPMRNAAHERVGWSGAVRPPW